MNRFEFFNSVHPISEEAYHLLTSSLITKYFRKGDVLTQPGQVQRELYFVKSGVQMSYFQADRKEHVIAFTYYPNLCAIPESFAFQVPSRYHLICLTDSELEALSYASLQSIFDASREVERLFRRLTEAVLAGIIHRHIELHSQGMEERFREFCSRSPHLLGLVPHKYLASYLGIDPTNFSKLYNSIRI